MRRLKRLMLTGRGYDLAPLFKSSCVAVYPRLGLVLNRIKKSGNTSTSAFLYDLEGRPAVDSVQDMKANLRSVADLSLAETWRFPRLYSIAVVRNPYSRVLSGFLHHVATGENTRHSAAPGYGDPSPDGFLAFLHWLEDGNIGYNSHFLRQTSLMFQAPARYDRLVKLETLVADMREVLRDIGRAPEEADKLAAPHPLEQRQAGKITGASRQRAEYFGPEASAVTARLYAADFDALGYDR